MADWSTAASLATAVGTLVLALATFVAVRAANRAARVAESSMQIGIRPLLMPSRLEDPVQKILWGDDFLIGVRGGAGIAEEAEDGAIHLAMSLRNSASGIAVIHGWHLGLGDPHESHEHAELDTFRPQIRDLYVAGGDIGFWQGALRESSDPDYASLVEAVRTRRLFEIELHYSDHEGGQHTIGRFALSPLGEDRWLCSMTRHWNLDRPDPRPPQQ
jgi:hypothetical protein